MRAVIDFLCEVISLICFCIWATLEAIYKLIIPQKGKSLSGEVALVTGAGHGIGKELCFQLSKDGAKGKSLTVTPPNFRVCARQKVPAKRFKICHILYIRHFSFRASTLLFP